MTSAGLSPPPPHTAQTLCTSKTMKLPVYILLFLTTLTYAQGETEFLNRFLFEEKLDTTNKLTQYNKYDFSSIWTKTESYQILGIIGADYQRIKVKIIQVEKDSINASIYRVTGMSSVKGNICDFNGTIILTGIKTVNSLDFGIRNEYVDSSIIQQGLLTADYIFEEDNRQYHSGFFKGKLYSKWYLKSNLLIQYYDIDKISDGYMNNAFIGTWRSYQSGRMKECRWADYSVPMAKPGFDIGAAEFSPSKEYSSKGWESYNKAWFSKDKEARKQELSEWWKN